MIRRAALALLLTLAFASPSAAADLARLEALVAAHPDEPSLHWALARATLDAGRPGGPGGAADQLARFRARWPGRQPRAIVLQGRALVEAARFSEALPVLEDAATRRPGDAEAQLYLGLARLRTGDPAGADAALARAAEIEPELAKSVSLLRGTSALSQGDARHGEAVLDELAAEDPQAIETRVASALLQRRRGPRERPRFRVWLDGGVEHDSNVTLDSGTGLAGVPTDQRDWRFQFGGGLSVDAWRSENARVQLGYRYDQTEHEDLEAFDLQSHQTWASGMLRVHPRVWLRLDGRAAWSRLDHEPYLDTWSVSPSLWIELGRRAGALRLVGQLEHRAFDTRPLLPSLERDGWVWGGALEHVVPLGFRRGAWISTSFRYRRTDTEGARDLFDLDSAFDANRYDLRLRSEIPLVFGVRLEAVALAGTERFDNANVIDLLTDDGVGDPTPSKRRDWIYEFRAALVRPLGRFVELELALRSTHRVSNVDVYAYERRIAGVYVTVHGP